MTNYYKILRVAKTATAQELKEAYYKLAKIVHPDAVVGTRFVYPTFEEVNQAYSILKDPHARHIFDVSLSLYLEKTKRRCQKCKGTGSITKQVGYKRSTAPCEECGGDGEEYDD